VHATGLPWNDPSGDHLRDWMGGDRATFYDETRVAIIPMGLCYPGRLPRGGDAPPRPECAPLWHPPLLEGLPRVALTLLVGRYAQARYLAGRKGAGMTETVRGFAGPLARDGLLPLPHPSWRNTAWLRRNPWFETDLLPVLRARVADLLGGGSPIP
jgi:uracil-DNA glycosylase